MASAARTLGLVLSASFTPPVAPTDPGPDLAEVLLGWADGLPTFRSRVPKLDPDDLRARALAILDALRPGNPAATPFRSAVRGGSARLLDWADLALAGHPESVDADAARLGLDAGLCRSVLRFTLLPTLARRTADLARLGVEPADWARGDCPHCGSRALLAESRGLEQPRILRCGLCAASWPTARLACSDCGCDDHHLLHSRCVEGEGDRYRLVRCDACGGSIKLAATLTALSAPGLMVVDLATVHLDLLVEVDDVASDFRRHRRAAGQ